MGFQAVLDAVRELSAEDQLQLIRLIKAELIQDQIEDMVTPQTEFSPAMVATIKDRVARYNTDPSCAIPWADVEAKVDKLLEELGE